MHSLSHISFPWLFSNKHLLIWQNFIKLFEPHLSDTIELDGFYFTLLMDTAKKWHKQNPKRLAIEAYIKLLKHEGRLYDNGFCYVCEEVLGEEIGLMRAFLPTHPQCIYANALNKKEIFKLFNTQSTIHLDDATSDKLYAILLKGF